MADLFDSLLCIGCPPQHQEQAGQDGSRSALARRAVYGDGTVVLDLFDDKMRDALHLREGRRTEIGDWLMVESD